MRYLPEHKRRQPRRTRAREEPDERQQVRLRSNAAGERGTGIHAPLRVVERKNAKNGSTRRFSNVANATRYVAGIPWRDGMVGESGKSHVRRTQNNQEQRKMHTAPMGNGTAAATVAGSNARSNRPSNVRSTTTA